MTISQNIAYATLKVNSYEYTYNYGESDKKFYTKTGEGATVKWQSKTDITAYTQPIYPSDIPTDINKVQTSLNITYRITITNSTNTNVEGYYIEKKMLVKYLMNTYDANRYELDDNQWKKIGNNQAKYDGTDFEGGINPRDSKETFITFKVKDEALTDLLEHPEGIIENYPTTASATTTHEYTRYDYSWKKSKDSSDVSRDTWRYYAIDNYYKNDTKNGKIHYSVPEVKNDQAPYLAIQLYKEDRTISGYVFKDDNIRGETNEVIGNGIYDDANEKGIEGVKVQLIDASTNKVANLYKIENKKSKIITEVTTDQKGQYKLEGVVPGDYYVRFTYGDGSQKYKDTNGNEIKIYSNGYKSTIINTDRGWGNIINSSQNNDRWYISLKDYKHNIAVDDGISNSSFTHYQVIDYRTQNNENSVKSSKNASTPHISVPIEFKNVDKGDLDSHNPSFDKMSFGIIEKPKIIMNIKKEITNVKLTLQNGQVLLNGNPATQNIPYVANLDTIWSKTGSRYVKVEMDNQYMHGALLELVYSLTVENDSEKFYTTEEYYKYGKVDENNEAKIKVNTLLEYLDPLLKIKLKSDIKEGAADNEYTYEEYNKVDIKNTNNPYNLARKKLAEGDKNIENKYNIVYEMGKTNQALNNNNTGLKTNIDNLGKTGVDPRDGSTEKIKVVAQKIISLSGEEKDDNLDYTSYAQISQITTVKNAYSDPTAAPLVKVNGSDYWTIPTDSSKSVLTPSTGLDRNMKYYVASIIVLCALGIVIVCLKKMEM